MIIGLIGYAQTGKDTVANILVTKYGYRRIAFADKIRELLYEMNPKITLGYDVQTTLQLMVDHGSWDEAKQNPDVRAMLQQLGVGARNVFGSSFWIEQALRGVGYYENVVVTDVRFENEATFIKKYEGSQIWRVTRPDVGPINGHVSETELEGYHADKIVKNGGTIKELEDLVKLRLDSYIDHKKV